jgi:hypothetical protein
VDNLLGHLNLAEDWGGLPWEIGRKRPERWASVYISLKYMLEEAKLKHKWQTRHTSNKKSTVSSDKGRKN